MGRTSEAYVHQPKVLGMHNEHCPAALRDYRVTQRRNDPRNAVRIKVSYKEDVSSLLLFEAFILDRHA